MVVGEGSTADVSLLCITAFTVYHTQTFYHATL
jgi:hypothetical protein